jgi:hypothetical protein
MAAGLIRSAVVRRGLVALLLAGTLAGPAAAQDLIATDCKQLQLPVRIDFENFPRVVNGTRYDNILLLPGARIGERFAGQKLYFERTFDRLDGEPEAPLRLLPGAPAQNLSVEARGHAQNGLNGIGPMGFARKNGSGEGAVSILFDTDHPAIGMTIEFEMGYAGAPPPGSARFQVFARDGRKLGDITLKGQGRSRVCLQLGDGVPAIAGVSITNDDIEGISIDDIAFDSAPPVG